MIFQEIKRWLNHNSLPPKSQLQIVKQMNSESNNQTACLDFFLILFILFLDFWKFYFVTYQNRTHNTIQS